jgi:FMN-dependent oxidoreductase (nitrilotriacetate monooxygenase family)
MNDAPRTMTLALYNASSGISLGSWRRAGSTSDRLLGLDLIAEIAQKCERAGLDALFLADNVSPKPSDFRQALNYPLEPMVVLGALSAVTSKIGLIATGSTSFIEPYNLARMMATIDHLSGGRAGWNIVSSVAGAHNFSTTDLDHDERYRMADEYLRVVTQLWDSWRDDAIVQDKASGMWADPARVSPIDFAGDFFQVRGPLNIPRSPQGWPVLAQAGSSPAGLSLASRWADLVFTPQPTLEGAQRFYSALKKQAKDNGRHPDSIRVLPGFVPIIGDTETEAKRLAEELLDLIDYEAGRADLQRFIAPVDITDLDLDEPIPHERLIHPDQVQTGRTKYAQLYDLATAGASLRDLVRVKSSLTDHAHATGTAEQVADVMESYFTEGGCDGFMLTSPYMMGGLDAITDQLVPVLKERGLFRGDYEGTTLRDHLGLERPQGR